MKCPRCGSTDLQKKGKRLGRQRYRCKDCSSSFTEGIKYKEAPIYEALDKVCSRCGSNNVVRDGKLQDGAQRYICKDCNLRFSDNSSESLTTSWECPYCGHTLVYSGYGKLGQREYRCNNCKRSCSGDQVTGQPIKRVYFSETNTDVTCPVCNSLNVRKAGISKDGRQKFVCKDCHKGFMHDYKLKPKPTGLKQEVIKRILNGENLRKVSVSTGYSERYIREFMEPYYAYETITKEQKNLITKFGCHCNVPINYLAQYIKCSERMCKKIIKQYNSEWLSPPASVPS